MRQGEVHQIEVTGLTHEGFGVGRVGDFVVFVPNVVPGDIVQVRLAVVKKTWAQGEALTLLQAAPNRNEPWCPHFLDCGGCQLQHLTYPAQLEWKQKQVEDALTRIGRIQVPIRPIIGMDNPFSYRNKAQLPLGLLQQQVVMGFYRKGTHEIVDQTECGIQHPSISRLAGALKKVVQELHIPPYDEKTHKGILRHGVIRVSFSQDELMLVLVSRVESVPNLKELINQLSREVPELVSIALNINPKITNVIFGPITRHVWGKSHLTDCIGNLQYAISARSFFQVNPVQTKVLYDEVKKALVPSAEDIVLDVYCGAGTIGLYVANEVKAVYGVEVIPEAICDAKLNAKLNGVTNAHFLVGDADKLLPVLHRKVINVGGVIVDPPRKGCGKEVLETIVKIDPKKIVYVSCNPSTLARDLAFLSEEGFTVKYVQPVDMFPHTSHVETVVLLER